MLDEEGFLRSRKLSWKSVGCGLRMSKFRSVGAGQCRRVYGPSLWVARGRLGCTTWRRSPSQMSSLSADLLRSRQRHLVIAGDVTPESLLPRIRKTFGQVPAGSAIPEVTSVEPPQRGERRVFLKRPASLPLYIAGYHVPTFEHDESFALSIAATILGGGRSARLQRSLVEEQQLVLSANAGYDRTSVDPTLFTLSMRVAPGKTWQAAEQALSEEITRLKTTLVTEKELERAKNLIESRFTYAQDSFFYRALQLGQ